MHFVGRIRTKLDNYPFNQTRGYPTWREANSLPYSGWAFNFDAQERYRAVPRSVANTDHPGAALSAATRRKITIFKCDTPAGEDIIPPRCHSSHRQTRKKDCKAAHLLVY